MPNLLKELKLTELSLVDTPANPEAFAPIFKHNSKEGDTEQMTETIKMSDDMKTKLKPYLDKGMSEEDAMKAYEENMKKSFDELKAENERLRKALLDEGFVIKADAVEKKAPIEYIEIEGEQINKAEIPAPILKRLEEAEAEKAQAAVEKKAEGFQNISKSVAVKLVKMDADQDEELLEFLRAVDAMFEKTMESAGDNSTDADMNTSADKLEKMVQEVADKESLSYAKAYAKVLDTSEGKELYKLMKKED